MIIKKRAIVNKAVFKRVPWKRGDESLCEKCNPCSEEYIIHVCSYCDMIGEITKTLKITNIYWGYIYEK